VDTENGNGFEVYEEREIERRGHVVRVMSMVVEGVLRGLNRAWRFHRIESPVIESPGVGCGDYELWKVTDGCVERTLRAETTRGSYDYGRRRIAAGERPPVCVWQAGKSFRIEQDVPRKFIKRKEFYQLEFQCIYTPDSFCDYYAHLLQGVREGLSRMVKPPVRIVASDRLPGYSTETMDIEADMGDRWMELASISRRKDFGDNLLVAEVSIGLDRVIGCENLSVQ
jgi:glycyl-tRNA synthetase